jgi:hypothetical protein
MKKNKYIGLIALIVLIVSFFATVFVAEAWTVSSNAWETAQGYKITIIKYEYETKTETPLASILLYTSTLVSDINMDLPGPIPQTYDDLDFEGVYLIGSRGITTHCYNQAAIVDQDTIDPESGKKLYNITTDEYATSYRRVTYKGEDIIYEDDYVNSFLEETVSPSTIDSFVRKYAAGKDNALNNFGVYIIPEEVDKYYISAEPVQRLVDKDKEDLFIYDEYIHHDFIHTFVESDAWSRSSWTSREVEYTVCGGNCHGECEGDDCAELDNDHPVTACFTATDQTDCFNKAYAKFGSAQTSAWLTCCGARKEKKTVYSLAQQNCGTQTHYLFYGYYGYGSSRIVTSRAMHLGLSYEDEGYYPASTDSAHLSRSQNVKEEHAECVLDINDECTDVYEYYIGPDLPKALVGTEESNVYNFVNVSGVEGIEHYYWEKVDICDDDECPTLCEDVCQEVGDRDTDAYLMCAEHFCEALVDYDLDGSQRERKKTCLLEECRYVYGKEPDTGEQPFDFPDTHYHSESIYSCNNSDPFAIYSGRELSNNSSTCNKDLNTGNQMQYVPGYLEECTDDDITDYDGNPRNDTGFDFRTYIIKSCLESTALQYPNLNGQTFLQGEGIAYFVNQESNRECRYYMNVEQWKFDYASISEKDTARKKRLKFIYDTFNNSLNEEYDGTQSPYYYNGEVDFVEEAYGTIDINSETYDDNKTSVESTVTEVVKNQQITEASETLNVIDSSKYDYSDIYYTGDILTLIEENTISYISGIHRFLKVSIYYATYAFDKECLTTEGQSNIYKADATGTCYKMEHGSVVESYEGSNVHYTSLDATPNEEFTTGGHHGFSTTALALKDATGATYYQNTDTCNYRIAKEGGNCSTTFTTSTDTAGAIDITVQDYGPRLEGETRSYSLKIYKKDGENAILVYSGTGQEHTFTPDDDLNLDYYLDGVVTSSILGDVYCPNTYNKRQIIIEDDYNCRTRYSPANLVDISDYCKSYWQLDVHNFTGPQTCINFCSKGCPSDCLSVDTLETFCETNYETLGVDTAAQCVNYCYCAVEGDYVFRPISNIDPFPDRTAGPNWIGLENLITQDDDDISSVTGVNANDTVEYVLNFSSNTIRNIRSNTEAIKAGGDSPYTDLIYKSNSNPTSCRTVGGRIQCETGTVSEYKSKFIHDSDQLNGGFSEIFFDGSIFSKGRTVAIEYSPSTNFEHVQ